MNLETIKAQIVEVLKKYPIKHASLFGSFSRNEQTEGSDIDILIEASESFTLFQLIRLENELTEKLSIKTDIVEFKALKASIRARVLAEAISIL
jgi:predicted nucleotidyltransferase